MTGHTHLPCWSLLELLAQALQDECPVIQLNLPYIAVRVGGKTMEAT